MHDKYSTSTQQAAHDRFANALALHQQGRLNEARTAYAAVLTLLPRHAPAMHHLGIVALQLGDLGEAMQRFETALRLDPSFVGAMLAKGDVLLDLGRPAEALEVFEHAATISAGELAAINGAGVALLELGRAAEALPLFTRAVAQAPAAPIYLLNRALAHAQLGNAQQALRDCAGSRALGHVTAQLCFIEGTALMDLGRQREAAAAFAAALALEPSMGKALNNLGSALAVLGEHAPAIESFERCLDLASDPATELWRRAQFNRASSLRALGRRSEAAAALEEVLRAAPDSAFVRGLLFHERLTQFDWRDYGACVAAILEGVRSGLPVDSPLSLLAVADEPEAQLRCAQLWVAAAGLPAARVRPGARARRNGPLRIAYLSSDFRLHAVSILIAGLLESHDRQAVETFALSTGADDGSPLRRRVVAGCDHFIDLRGVQNAEIAARIAALGIDILVDLNGHSLGGRPGVLALRPAALQVNFLGFPGTLGGDLADYIIADEFVLPPDRAACFSERVIYMPDCFQPNDDRRVVPGPCTRAAAGLPEGGLVFCAFNTSHKLNPPMFDIWCGLLRATPGSVLWVVSPGGSSRGHLCREAEARGVAAQRLVFAEQRPYAEHISRIVHADLFLDTLPFNGGTTTSDFLWAGVPVVTCAGRSFASRMSGSLLCAVGLPELITETPEDYARLALELAHDPPRLAQLRSRLVAGRDSAALFDTRRYCRNLEAAYQEIWQRHERGEQPAAIHVRSLAASACRA
ncbi:MAG: tetratricopeptide repeat protein [Gammaproteobacteria bacterium]|nr:tetratricopeptide repeat protein [Gammaproteobacteria bacterium]